MVAGRPAVSLPPPAGEGADRRMGEALRKRQAIRAYPDTAAYARRCWHHRLFAFDGSKPMTDTSASLAFVFPGQGSQSVGMLADLAAAHAEVQATFEEA